MIGVNEIKDQVRVVGKLTRDVTIRCREDVVADNHEDSHKYHDEEAGSDEDKIVGHHGIKAGGSWPGDVFNAKIRLQLDIGDGGLGLRLGIQLGVNAASADKRCNLGNQISLFSGSLLLSGSM